MGMEHGFEEAVRDLKALPAYGQPCAGEDHDYQRLRNQAHHMPLRMAYHYRRCRRCGQSERYTPPRWVFGAE